MKKNNAPQGLNDFNEIIRKNILKGEGLEQLSKALKAEAESKSNFEARKKAFEQGLYSGRNFEPGFSCDFNNGKPKTVEAEFEVVESILKPGERQFCETITEPGEDLIATPAGEETVAEWDARERPGNPFFIPASPLDISFDFNNTISHEERQMLIYGNWNSEGPGKK